MMIKLDRITFSFPGSRQPFFYDLTAELGIGPLTGIVGGNGSGKSTLARLICGLLTPHSGSVTVNGREITARPETGGPPRVGMVFQNPDEQFVAATVEREVAFGLENQGIEPGQIRQQVDAMLKASGLAERRRQAPHQLSGGEKQKLAIISMLAVGLDYLILDESLSMLDKKNRQEVYAFVRRTARETQTGILFISKWIDELAECDPVLVLHRGQVLSSASPAQIKKQVSLLEDCGLRSGQFPELKTGIKGPPLIRLEQMSCGYGPAATKAVLKDIDLTFRQNESVAITGPVGSGKTTLLLAINGLVRPYKGSVLIDGRRWEPGSRQRNLREKVAMVFQYPEAQFFEDSVYREITYTARNLETPAEQLEGRITFWCQAAGLDLDAIGNWAPSQLSYGGKRLVSIISAVLHRPLILLLDEPFTGLDPAGVQRVLSILYQLQKEGITLVVVTHDEEIITGLVDRVIRLEEGRVVGESVLLP